VDAGEDREYSRQPRPEDLTKICAALNREGARYVLIGGFAVIARGLERPTKDIHLLIDPSAENVERIKRALAVLSDNAVQEVESDEIERYDVIRVADEVVVDLMAKACGVTWADAERDSEVLELDGVEIPIAGIQTLIRTKQTVRPHDAADIEFLERLREESLPLRLAGSTERVSNRRARCGDESSRRAITLSDDPQPQELNVSGIAWTNGLLRFNQELFTADRDRYSFHRLDYDSSGGRPSVVDATRILQQVNDDFVRDPHDFVFLDLIVCDQRDCVVGQHGHRAFQPLHVVRSRIDEQVDVLRGPNKTMQDDRESTDQNVPDALGVQRPAEREEVFELRCA
jgi:hypothetical protein